METPYGTAVGAGFDQVSCEVEPFEGWKHKGVVLIGQCIHNVSCEVEPFEGWKLRRQRWKLGQRNSQLRGRTL